MATVSLLFEQPSDQFFGIGSAFPQSVRNAGTNFPVEGLAFADNADEACVVKFKIKNYGSGNITAILTWYADTATSNNVVWGAAIAAITPSSGDNQNVETKAFATENTVTAACSGTAQEIENASITISNLDSVAANDWVWLRIRRVGTNGSDNMSGDAVLIGVELQYSDT